MTRVRPLEPADRDAWLAMRRDLWPDADPAELAREVQRFLTGSAGQEQLPLVVLLAEAGDNMALRLSRAVVA